MAVERSAGSGSIQIGAYSLVCGSGSGSFAQYAADRELTTARALEDALKAVPENRQGEEEPDRRLKAVAAIEDFQETAEEITGKIEQAERLLQAASTGKLLDLGNVTGEIDSLLDLFARLDRAGRFEEELRLMRSLNGLLALTLRWLDLIRSLRSLLGSADAAGHVAGKAFAHHELGSLYLCAGHPERAIEHLQEAVQLQARGGIPIAGRCATRHNLDSAHRDLALEVASGIQPPRRLQRLLVLAGAAAVAASGGAGLALAVHGRGGHHSTTASTTVASPSHKHAVVVQIAGMSIGSISGPGLACPNDCSTSIQDGRTITLAEKHGIDSVFEGWSKSDCARSSTCSLKVTGGATVVATFSRKGNPPPPPRPLAPTGLAATSVSPTEIDLAWFKPTGGAAVDHYVIYRDQHAVANVQASLTSYQDTRVTASTRYVYSVTAVAANQKPSPSSSSAEATTLPSAPTLVSANEAFKGEIDLVWTASFPNSDGSYIVYRDGEKLVTVAGTQATFPDTPVDTSADHTYTVQAVDAFGKSSSQSNQVAYTPPVG